MNKTYSRLAVEELMGKDLKWDDFDEVLTDLEKDKFAQEAAIILNTSIFKNEKKRLVDLWIRSAALEATSIEQLKNMQMCVSALELFEERLIDISSWNKRKNNDINEDDDRAYDAL